MSVTKAVLAVKDSITFTLNEADLTGKKVGEELKTLARDVPCTNGPQWWIRYYPAGGVEDSKAHLSVFLMVNKTISSRFSFKVQDSSIETDMYAFNLTESVQCGCTKFASHEALRPLFVDGKLLITCDVEFDVSVPFTFLSPRLAQHCGHVPTDFQLIVGSNQLQVHKSLLSLVSPVFHAMFSHDTDESRSGEVKIKDFDFDTVQTTIDFCYGKEMETPSVETVISMLRFADKYDIKVVTNLLKPIPRQSLSNETFHTVVHYADKCCDDELFEDCCDLFFENQSDIVATEKFKMLPPPTVTRLLKDTFDLETQFDVIRHAHANGMDFILAFLEQPIINLTPSATLSSMPGTARETI
uniref:BTB domain-containing protein n=1 Tax=Panagrellus redivivus TaxID=6233 RepID=A0A7E4V3R1_PANRE